MRSPSGSSPWCKLGGTLHSSTPVYIRALLDDRDDRHAAVARYHTGLRASLYTSALVVAEAARQFAKADQVPQDWRWTHVTDLASIISTSRRITVCAPPDEEIVEALAELTEMQKMLVRLDLCDLVSMRVLDALSHRRVLGFDDHFRSVGASLEPGI